MCAIFGFLITRLGLYPAFGDGSQIRHDQGPQGTLILYQKGHSCDVLVDRPLPYQFLKILLFFFIGEVFGFRDFWCLVILDEVTDIPSADPSDHHMSLNLIEKIFIYNVLVPPSSGDLRMARSCTVTVRAVKVEALSLLIFNYFR